MRRLAAALVLLAGPAGATTLTLSLPGAAPVTRHVVRYRCDAEGVALGLPAAGFAVIYLASGQTGLALLPAGGRVFAQVLSADGGRYAAGRLVWWDTGARGATLSDGTRTAHCNAG